MCTMFWLVLHQHGGVGMHLFYPDLCYICTEFGIFVVFLKPSYEQVILVVRGIQNLCERKYRREMKII